MPLNIQSMLSKSMVALTGRRYFPFFLFFILIVSAIIRVKALLCWNESLYGKYLPCDGQVYHYWAISILDGVSKFPVVHDFTAMYAYFTAFIYFLFSPDPFFPCAVNVVFGTLTCLLIYLIGTDIGGRSVGMIACVFASLYKPFIFFSIAFMKTALSLFLFSLLIWIFLRTLNKENTLINPSILGVIAGLLLNVRANCIFMLPMFPAVFFWMYRKNEFSARKSILYIACYIVGLALSIAPFTFKNYRSTGEFSLTATGGFNFYMGWQPGNPYPFYRPVSFAAVSPVMQSTYFIIEASKRSGRKLTSSEASRFWISETIKVCQENPGKCVDKLFWKTMAVFNRFEPDDNFDIEFVSNFVDYFRLPFFEIWMLLPMGIAGMIVSVNGSAKHMFLIAVMVAYAVTLIIIFTNIRIRLPIMTIMIPFAAVGLKKMVMDIKNRNISRVIKYSITTLAFIVIAFLSIPGDDDLTAQYNIHAATLYRKGLKSEAWEWWLKSSQMHGFYSDSANIDLAKRYFQRDEIKKAFEYLDKVSDTSLSAAYKYIKQGDFLSERRKVGKAVEAYEASLKINSGQLDVIRKLIRIYSKTDPGRSEELKKQEVFISSFFHNETTVGTTNEAAAHQDI